MKLSAGKRGGVLLLLFLALVIYVFRVPCPFYTVTGYLCPGCGVTRMIDALLHGDLSAAFGYNPFLMVATPVLLLAVVDEKCHPKQRQKLREGLYIALVFFAVVFAVCRNIGMQSL